MSETIFEGRQIHKSFPGVVALKNVDFTLEKGEIKALVGKNGAGKSTLIKIFTGIYHHDSGEIFLNGENISHVTPEKMYQLGIAAIYQENDLIPYFTVGESIMLNHEPKKMGNLLIDKQKLYERSGDILQTHLNSDLDPRALIRDLNVSQRQLVQIARNLVTLPRVMIFDEPTAALSAKEIARLFAVIKSLKAKGVSIIYISHRFDEVFELADSITVLRDGENIAERQIGATTKEDIIKLMAGEEGVKIIRHRSLTGNFETSALALNGCANEYLSDVRLELRKGEILGVYGGEGAGQQKLAQAIFGLSPFTKGELALFGKHTRITNPHTAIEQGMGYIPRNRKEEGVIINFNICQNISLPIINTLSSKGFINKPREAEMANVQFRQLSIKAPDILTTVRMLSGGNQQKVVLGRWIAAKPAILILDYPTMGIDIKAKSEVYNILHELTQQGMAMLLITPEYEEIAVLCDRVLVMRNRRIVKEFNSHEFEEHKLLGYAIGLDEKETGYERLQN